MKNSVQYSPILHTVRELYKTPTENEPWVNLRNAIIAQAADDYVRIGSCKRQNLVELRMIEKFFLDGYCDFLLAGAEITGEVVLDRLQKKVNAEREKRGILEVEPNK